MFSWITNSLRLSVDNSSSNSTYQEIHPDLEEKVVYSAKSSLEEARIQSLNVVLNKSEIELEVLQQLCFDGIPDKPRSLKATCWKVLLGYLPIKTSSWDSVLEEQRRTYASYLEDIFHNPVYSSSIPKKSVAILEENNSTTTSKKHKKSLDTFEEVDPSLDPLSETPGNIWTSMYEDCELKNEIEKDIKRTHQCLAFIHKELDQNSESKVYNCNFNLDEPTHEAVLIRILLVYGKLNPGVKYVQGMNELLFPLYYVCCLDDSENSRHAEADAFFCFTQIMSYLTDRFIKECDNSQLGLNACLQEFDATIRIVDEEVSDVLIRQELDARYYALRWLSLCLAMEFALPETLRLWDSFFSDPNKFKFVTYFAVSMVVLVRDQIISNDFARNMQLLQHFTDKNQFLDINTIFRKAIEIQQRFEPSIFEGASRF